MDVRSVRLGEVTEPDARRWRALAARALEPNPALEPEALLAAAAHLPEWGRLPLLHVTDGDDMVLCALARPLRRWHRLPLPALTSRPEDGVVPLYVVLGTPLVDPSRSRAAGGVAREWTQACTGLSLPIATSDAWERPVLVRESLERDSWPASLGRRRLAEVERRRRRLAEELGGAVECRDRSHDPAAVEQFIRLEAAGWKGRADTALEADAARSAAFREACRRWAADRRLLVLSLEAGDTVLAVGCAVRSGEGLFLVKSAYDERYARFGPGFLLYLATSEHFLSATDASWMDSCCAPSNEFFRDFLPHRLPVATSTTSLGSVGSAALAGLPFLDTAATWLRPRTRRAPVTPARNSRSTSPPVATTVEDTVRRSG